MTVENALPKRSAFAVLVGAWAAAVALAPSLLVKSCISIPVALAALSFWVLNGPARWVILFLVAGILLPPLPVALGNSGPHPALFLAALGVLAGLMRLHRWEFQPGLLEGALLVFSLILLFSVTQSVFYSGVNVALGSLARVCLFAIAPYLFFFSSCGPGRHGSRPMKMIPYLFWAAIAAAAFACLDFYFQWPAPAGFGPQFVWLPDGVFRRAQGVFYEASTLGNFCSFFLVMIVVSLFWRRPGAIISRMSLLLGGIVLGTALLLSYSRASILNLFVAMCALVFLRRERMGRIVLVASAIVLGAAGIAYFFLPAFSSLYWERLALLQYFWSAPNGVLSGRIDHWTTLLDFAARQPWSLLFGIGYKTLPYSEYLGANVIGDNTYFSLLIETGVIGLTAFVLLNVAILRCALRAARSPSPSAAFFGAWIFCFWAGELVQMASGDLITYWRVLPLYFWVLAAAKIESRLTLSSDTREY
jgi:hypothetical protein